MYAIYMPISWGGFGGQCRHIWQSHGVFGYVYIYIYTHLPLGAFASQLSGGWMAFRCDSRGASVERGANVRGASSVRGSAMATKHAR